MKKFLNELFSDLNFLTMVIIALFMCYLLIWSESGRAETVGGRVRTIYLNDQKIEKILIRPGKLTVLSFPMKPDNSVVGIKDAFALSYIESDIVIGAKSPSAHTNMFVYLFGRRFAFNLMTNSGLYDEIVVVKDSIAMNEPTKPNKGKTHVRK